MHGDPLVRAVAAMQHARKQLLRPSQESIALSDKALYRAVESLRSICAGKAALPQSPTQAIIALQRELDHIRLLLQHASDFISGRLAQLSASDSTYTLQRSTAGSGPGQRICIEG
jgi:hypothetical protein